MGFLNFIVGRDVLGHQIGINYKGSMQYQTLLGAVISITIQALVLVKLFLKTEALISMSDPSIESISRPIYPDE